jgi:hypothetical protein
MLDPGQFFGRTELAPADAILALEDKSCMRPVLAHATFLFLTAINAPNVSFRMKFQAPTAPPDPVVKLDQARESLPRRGV